MNKDQTQARADHLAARIKQEWGKLTDDEVTRAEGNMDELIASIQQSYGDSREKIAEKINQLKHKLDED
ncbi:MAG: CsbD family protein [Gammaproteobacteria bacterium]|nr:CsbD family protein [Gammaproteobacteria bacterium]